jgi:hypothetical protein
MLSHRGWLKKQNAVALAFRPPSTLRYIEQWYKLEE